MLARKPFLRWNFAVVWSGSHVQVGVTLHRDRQLLATRHVYDNDDHVIDERMRKPQDDVAFDSRLERVVNRSDIGLNRRLVGC